jgi:hypothetical protein
VWVVTRTSATIRQQVGTGPEHVTFWSAPWGANEKHLAGTCVDEAGVAWALNGVDGNFLTLAMFEAGARRLGSHAVSLTPDRSWPIDRLVPMVARKGVVYIAGDDHVVTFTNGAVRDRIACGKPVRALSASPPYTRARVAATHDEGATVLTEYGDAQPIATSLRAPAVAFAGDGTTIAVGAGAGHAYRPTRDGKRLQFVGGFPSRPDAPLAVLPAAAGEVTVVWADGVVHVLRMTGR